MQLVDWCRYSKMVPEIRVATFPFSCTPRRAVGIRNKSWLFKSYD